MNNEDNEDREHFSAEVRRVASVLDDKHGVTFGIEASDLAELEYASRAEAEQVAAALNQVLRQAQG